MYQAVWNDVVLAESEDTVRVEGNHYFPPESMNSTYFSSAPMTSQCPWKGTAKYYTLSVGGGRETPTQPGITPTRRRQPRTSATLLPSRMECAS